MTGIMTGATPYLLTSIVSAAVPAAVAVPVLSNRVSKANEEKDKVKRELNDAKNPGSDGFKQTFQELIKGYYDKNQNDFSQNLSKTLCKCYSISDDTNNKYWICYEPSETHTK